MTNQNMHQEDSDFIRQAVALGEAEKAHLNRVAQVATGVLRNKVDEGKAEATEYIVKSAQRDDKSLLEGFMNLFAAARSVVASQKTVEELAMMPTYMLKAAALRSPQEKVVGSTLILLFGWIGFSWLALSFFNFSEGQLRKDLDNHYVKTGQAPACSYLALSKKPDSVDQSVECSRQLESLKRDYFYRVEN